ncbi:hypothetical protein BKA81DRAFT_360585 [Phyllosticta paracitricarpa]
MICSWFLSSSRAFAGRRWIGSIQASIAHDRMGFRISVSAFCLGWVIDSILHPVVAILST